VLGLAGALLVGAPEPDLAVLTCAAAGAVTVTLTSGRKLGSESLTPALLALAVLRLGISEISRNPLVGAVAVATASLLLATLVRGLLTRRRLRRTVSGR
jgi:predicted lysophospholipase L1 biosynthesis ABC-type transport system permease subunit